MNFAAAHSAEKASHQVLVRRAVQYHLTDWFNE